MKQELRKTFLKNIKKYVLMKNLIVVPRGKNVNFMREYGLNISDLKEMIFDLSPNDCIDGPEPDRDGYEGHVLEFKSNYIDEIITYVKIRYNPPDEVVCISFHEDE